MVNNLSFVKRLKTKNNLKRDQYCNDLKKLVVQTVKEFDNVGTLKFDNELLKFVCNCIENGLKSKYEKKQKTDKKALVIQIFDEIFSLNDDEKKKLGNNIDFLCSNELIDNINIFYKCGLMSFDYLKSKL
jgi:hypothetical protein